MSVRENSWIPVRLTAPRAHNAVGLVRRISDLRWWSALCLVAALSTSASAADKDSWQIRILPATKVRLAQAPAPAPAPAMQGPSATPAPKSYEPTPAPAGTQAPGQLRIIPGRPHPA